MPIAGQRFGKHVPAATKKQNNRGSVRHDDLYSAHPGVIKELIQFIRGSER
jgi:hypothetical protein